MMICPGCKKETRSADFCQWCFVRLDPAPSAGEPIQPPIGVVVAAPNTPSTASKGVYNPMVPIVVPKSAPPPSIAGEFDLSPSAPARPPQPAIQQTQPVPAYPHPVQPATANPAAYNPVAPPLQASQPVGPYEQPLAVGSISGQPIPGSPLPGHAVVSGVPMPPPAGACAQPQPVANYLTQPVGGSPFAPPAQSETDKTRQVRMSLTGEVYEVDEPAIAPAANYLPPGGAAANYLPPGGMAPPLPMARSATGRFTPAAAGLPATAVTAGFVQQSLISGSASIGERWEKFLAISMPILAISILIIHFAPDAMIWIALADMFIFGLVQGATRSIPSYDEAFLDCSVVLLVCWLVGPLPGLVAYLIVGTIKQEWNTAILSVLGVHIVMRLVLAVAFESAADSFNLIPQFGFIPGASFVGVCCSFAGWILSSFFRPLDE